MKQIVQTDNNILQEKNIGEINNRKTNSNTASVSALKPMTMYKSTSNHEPNTLTQPVPVMQKKSLKKNKTQYGQSLKSSQ